MITGYRVKACPRCGAGQAYLHLHTKTQYLVRCGKCGAVGPAEKTAEEAVSGWNDRRWNEKWAEKTAKLLEGGIL